MIACMRVRRYRRHSFPTALAAVIAAVLVASCSTVIGGSGLPEDGTGSAGSSTAADDSGATHQITEPPSGSAGTSAGTSAGSTSSAATDDPALSRYYDQQLDWGSCTPYMTSDDDALYYGSPGVQCAYLTVPMDYADPDGATVSIGVLRHRATGDAIGSLVMNPGGPGASGMSIAAQLAYYQIGGSLLQRFDLVGFDPRGVGSSRPYIACQTDAERDAARLAGWPGYTASSTDADVEAANAMSQKFVADCVSTISRQGVDATAFLAQLGTTTVAKDLDVLRAVLGDEKLSYIGWSYGTSIGTQYAEQFPDKVRAMVLDGAVDPSVDTATDAIEQTTAFQKAFEAFAAWCAGRPDCPWDDASAASQRFQALAQPLMDVQLPLSDGRKLSFLDAATAVADALYSEGMWRTLASALSDFAHGSGDAMMALADDYYGRDSSGHYSEMLESFNAIRCMDGDRITDPKAATELNARLVAASPFQDNGQPPAAIFDICTYWPVPPTMTAHVPDPTGLAPVLVISTLGDPATPYQSGVNLAKYLRGRLLTVEGTDHTGFLTAGAGCVDTIGIDYLVDLTLPAEGARCSS